tara:strand:- start:1200 stop:1538 length:339 start_codon:yes stop_codon:yes gene_type:complete
MFNFQLDLEHADKLIQSPIAVAAFCIALCCISILIGMSHGSVSKEDVCGEELEQVQVQNKQIIVLEAKHAKCIADGETSCIEREQRLCRQDKESIKMNCNELIERIVKGQKE